MQQDRSAHCIPGLPHCLIDGFKHSLDHIPDVSQRIYFLTHFHSDHYMGLSQGWRAGHIYCSTTTAKLLINVMKIRRVELIHAVDIGETVTIPGATVTFLDANHCPGAAMLLFHLDSGLTHLHTGDMRYHPRMKDYLPLQNSKIDKIFLDTTYAHPKHQFRAQADAINDIIRQVKDFLFIYGDSGLVYLSAYNLGKERVIFSVQDAVGLPIYMDDEKLNIINQIEGGPERIASGMFTSDPLKANIHVCGMGMVGFVGQYFRANFENLETNRMKLNEFKTVARSTHSKSAQGKLKLAEFTHVLAFIPTGWAESSSYNRSHSYQVQDHLAVQLIPYSEHSQYQELMDFVGFLKPREVVPTVYADDRNRVFIIHLFRNLVDKRQNMQNFLSKFNSKSNSFILNNGSASSSPSPRIATLGKDAAVAASLNSYQVGKTPRKSPFQRLKPDEVIVLDDEDDIKGHHALSHDHNHSLMDIVEIDQDPSSSDDEEALPITKSNFSGSDIGNENQRCIAPAGGMMNLWLKSQQQQLNDHNVSNNTSHVTMSSVGSRTNSNQNMFSLLPIPSPLSITSPPCVSAVASSSSFSSQLQTSTESRSSISLLPPPIITNPTIILNNNLSNSAEMSMVNNDPNNSLPPLPPASSLQSQNLVVDEEIKNSITATNIHGNNNNNLIAAMMIPSVSSLSTTAYASERSTPKKRAATEFVSEYISQDLCMTLSTSPIQQVRDECSPNNVNGTFQVTQQQQHTFRKRDFPQSDEDEEDSQLSNRQNARIGLLQSYSMDEQELMDVVPTAHQSKGYTSNFGLFSNGQSLLNTGFGANTGGSTACTPSMAMLSMRSRATSMNDVNNNNGNVTTEDGPRVPTPSQKKYKVSPTSARGPPLFNAPPVFVAQVPDVHVSRPTSSFHADENSGVHVAHSTTAVSSSVSSSAPSSMSTAQATATSTSSSSYTVPPTPRGRRAPPMSSWTTYHSNSSVATTSSTTITNNSDSNSDSAIANNPNNGTSPVVAPLPSVLVPLGVNVSNKTSPIPPPLSTSFVTPAMSLHSLTTVTENENEDGDEGQAVMGKKDELESNRFVESINKVPATSSSWTCNKCTFINSSSNNSRSAFCTMCQANQIDNRHCELVNNVKPQNNISPSFKGGLSTQRNTTEVIDLIDM